MDYGFVRVSTGSQDAQTQRRDILAASPDAQIITTDTRSASASKGEQVDAMDKLIATLAPGDKVIVTDSSRLDRREDLDAQADVLLRIRSAGGDVVSLTEPTFGKTDFAGRIVTLVAQHSNAEKSRTVKNQTYRGVSSIRDNLAHHGQLPMFWTATGERYRKQASCTDPALVRDIYKRVADGESLSSVARSYATPKGDRMYPTSVRTLVAFTANHTGVIECSYTHQGKREVWHHKVESVVDSALWWRANKRLEANKTRDREHRGGRPVAQASNWLSGILTCPECGGKLYVNAGKTPAGNPRVPKLRCGGMARVRKSCGKYDGAEARLVMDELDKFFAGEDLPILAFQRVTGNAHELAAMESELARLMAQPTPGERADRRQRLDDIEDLEDRIAAFTVIPDTFAYAPTGQTVASMWAESDAAKRRVVKAVKDTMGLDITPQWGIDEDNLHLGVIPGELRQDDIVDLGDGVCFRMPA